MSKLYRWTLETSELGPNGEEMVLVAQATGTVRMIGAMVGAAATALAADLNSELAAAGFQPFPGESTGSSTPPAAVNGGGRRTPRKRATPAVEPTEQAPPQLPPAEQIPVGTEHASAPVTVPPFQIHTNTPPGVPAMDPFAPR